jgi:hypothetical protein
VLLEGSHGRGVKHSSISRNADIDWLELTLSPHAVDPLFQVDGSVLLMLKPRNGSAHPDVTDIKVACDVARQCVVPIEGDAPEKLVVMAGKLALGDNHGICFGGAKDDSGHGCIHCALNQKIPLGTQM